MVDNDIPWGGGFTTTWSRDTRPRVFPSLGGHHDDIGASYMTAWLFNRKPWPWSNIAHTNQFIWLRMVMASPVMREDAVIYDYKDFSPTEKARFRFAFASSNDLFYSIQEKALAPLNTITKYGVPRNQWIRKASTANYPTFGAATYFQPLVMSIPEPASPSPVTSRETTKSPTPSTSRNQSPPSDHGSRTDRLHTVGRVCMPCLLAYTPCQEIHELLRE